MDSRADSASRADSVPPQKQRRGPKAKSIGASPLHTICLYRIYEQHLPQTRHMPWMYYKDFSGTGLKINDSDENGFVRGMKLEPHNLRTMNLLHEDVFPKCQGINRCWFDDQMYPQYGNLKSNMFRTNKPTPPEVLQERREEMIEIGCLGIQVLEAKCVAKQEMPDNDIDMIKEEDLKRGPQDEVLITMKSRKLNLE